MPLCSFLLWPAHAPVWQTRVLTKASRAYPCQLFAGGWVVGVCWNNEMRSPSVINAWIPSHPSDNLPLLQSLLLSRHTFWISAIVLLGLRNVLESAPTGSRRCPCSPYFTRLLLFLFMLLSAKKVWWPQEAFLPSSMILIVNMESAVFVLEQLRCAESLPRRPAHMLVFLPV